MIRHAIADTSAIRAILRYPPRSGKLYLSSKRPVLASTSAATSTSYLRIEHYNTGDDNTRNWRDKALTPKGNFQDFADKPLHDYTSKEGVINALEKEISAWVDNKPLAGKISQWGLRGDSLKAILTEVDPEHPQREGSPASVIKALLQLWGEEISASLKDGINTSAADIDLENARLGIEAEGIDSVKRLLMNSFLCWLESQLKAQPGGARLLARTQSLLSLADMRYPSLRYETARSIVRQIHLHVGPTNSGKTHGALVALCKAETGLYAGPLRLLAHEVWERIRSGTVSPGISARPCDLKTGEEIKIDDKLAGLCACTVEMINYTTLVDVAVVDEIQMIGDPQRGGAWTTAVLGLPAKELHLCGESSVIPLIKKIAEACGDVLHIHNYERLTPLKIGPPLGGDLKGIKKGDCLVAFSRSEIFWLKNQIETLTTFKCALAYGALPPETKSEQARKFNDPDNDVSVMVASDAIGMGLNLKIKRIIFYKVNKWNGKEVVPISISQLKQIAGRAGRYGTSSEDAAGGLATTLHDEDLGVLKAALESPFVPITRAGIQPAQDVLIALAMLLPGKKRQEHRDKGVQRDLMTLYSDLSLLSQVDSRIYFAASQDQPLKIGPLLEELVSAYRYMTIADRDLFAIAPANYRDERLVALLCNMVNYYARGGLVRFEDVDCLDMLKTMKSVESVAEAFNRQNQGKPLAERSAHLGSFLKKSTKRFNIDDLMVLESLHRGLTLYLWLSYRKPVSFCYRSDVEDYSRRAEKAIDFCLEAVKAARAVRLASQGIYRDNTPPGQEKPWAEMSYKERQNIRDRHRREGFKRNQGSGRFANSNINIDVGRGEVRSNV